MKRETQPLHVKHYAEKVYDLEGLFKMLPKGYLSPEEHRATEILIKSYKAMVEDAVRLVLSQSSPELSKLDSIIATFEKTIPYIEESCVDLKKAIVNADYKEPIN